MEQQSGFRRPAREGVTLRSRLRELGALLALIAGACAVLIGAAA